MLIDDGMKPYVREALFRLQQDQARDEARAKARAARPAPPDGHEYLDVALADLSARLQHDGQAAAEARVDVEGAIRAGDLRATSARKKLPIRPGTKFDPDDCLVTMPALFAWADVDGGQAVDRLDDPDAAACEGAPAERGEPMPVIQERELLRILAGLGCPAGVVPNHKGGRKNDLKAACWEQAQALPRIFTMASFNKAWGRLKRA